MDAKKETNLDLRPPLRDDFECFTKMIKMETVHDEDLPPSVGAGAFWFAFSCHGNRI